MMRKTPNCPICQEDELVLYRAGDTFRLLCVECSWRTSGPILDGVDIDDAIAAAVAKAQEPSE